MKLDYHGETLTVSEIEEIAATNAEAFQLELRDALAPDLNHIEIDLSKTGFVDCGGLGALIALGKGARRHNAGVALRLLNPRAPVAHIFQLTRMDRMFSIEGR
jgi:anti-anti-sigma factor